MMVKDYDRWNESKQSIDRKVTFPDAHPREIWWCAMGVNIGTEINGKNEDFERPVVIMRAYNRETMIVVPLTSKTKNDAFHYHIATPKSQCVSLTQMRVVSSKRLLRKVGILSESEFTKLKTAWKKVL